MDFILRGITKSISSLARKIGYRPQGDGGKKEYSLVKCLTGADYPRFHLYIKEDEENKDFSFSLHLDQKFPSYNCSHRHSGEYSGEAVEKEAERIKNILTDGIKDDGKGRVYKF